MGVSAVTLVVGAYQANQAQQAASAQQSAAQQGLAAQQAAYQQQMQLQMPWIQAGQSALGQLTAGFAPGGEFTKQFGLSDFQASPEYQFALQAGQGALQNRASATGSSLSGAQQMGLMQYGQQLAGAEFQNAFSNWQNQRGTVIGGLSNLANMGQGATNVGTQAAGNLGLNQANLYGQIGDAQAAAAAARSRAIGGTLNNLFGIYAYNRGRNPGTTDTTATGTTGTSLPLGMTFQYSGNPYADYYNQQPGGYQGLSSVSNLFNPQA